LSRVAAIFLIVFLSITTILQANDKLTSSARRLATADYPHIYWVFINSEGWSQTPVTFTQAALLRRAKAGVVFDSLDFPVASEILDSLTDAGLTVRRASRWLKAVSIEADAAALSKVATYTFVDSIDVHHTYNASLPSLPTERPVLSPAQNLADSVYGYSALQNEFINVPIVHSLGIKGDGVRLAVLDTGYDIEHPGLDSASIIATYDFINSRVDVTGNECENNTESNFQNSHGTWALGVIAANVPDEIIGIAPAADFILAKTEITCDATEIRVEEDNWIAAAEWADSLGADIITSSLGYHNWQDDVDYSYIDLDGNTAYITIAADMAASRNILVVTSAGNERGSLWGRISFPGDGDSVLAVGATYSDSSVTSFSSPGPTADGRIKPDVATLGVNVITLRAEPARGYRYVGGTSFAAPAVAGVAALIMQRNPDMTAHEVFEELKTTASLAGNPNNDLGWGVIDAYKAASYAHFEDLPDFRVRVGETAEVTVTAAGGIESAPVIDGWDFPEGVTLLDKGDGTATVTMIGLESAPYRQTFFLRAAADGVADTAELVLETSGRSDHAIYAGPNPFRDTVYIYADNTAGTIKSVSIYNVAGEKIWEKVNASSVSADAISRWDRVAWPGRSQSGEPVAAGIYMVHVTAENATALLKLLKLD